MKMKKIVTVGLLSLTFSGVITPVLSNIHVHAQAENRKIIYLNNPENHKYVNAYLDEDGNVVVYYSSSKERGFFTAILIFVGTAYLGTITVEVIDGVIKHVTGVNRKEVTSDIIVNNIIGKKYTGNRIDIPDRGAFTCLGFVIDHSGMCR